jgi:Domain of unknown function (DUF4178)
VIRFCQCPSCGAKVEFRAITTLLAICEYCKSTLVRTDIDVENIGKMADLLPDSSLLQIGSQGTHKQMAFNVIGRVQYQHESGVWNEWHLLFSNGNTGWLSEASGSFVLSFLNVSGTPPLTLEQYKLDLSLPILGQRLTVTNIEKARCIAGQGELPFKINTGFDVTVVDLSNETVFASIDFSETPPHLFLGEHVELSSLALSNLRDIEQTATRANARSFSCPNCASPVEAVLSNSRTIVCKSCSAILDISNKNVDVIVKSQKVLGRQVKPVIELGSVGHFEGVDYTAIGYIRRSTRSYGLNYYWSEFLLHHPGYGFRWLISSDGHWTFAEPLQKSPAENKSYSGRQTAFLNKTYKHFSTYRANTVQVLGEFYWKVKLDDKATIQDFVSPPSILSKEKTANEVTWTQGEYIDKQAVENAFKNTFSLPDPINIAANQPSPYDVQAASWIKACLFFIVFAFGIQMYLTVVSENRLVLETSANFQKGGQRVQLIEDLWMSNDNIQYQSPEFEVKGRASNLIIEQSVNLNNNWLATDVSLVEKNTGLVLYAEREAGYYYGYDSEGSWTEDNSRQEIIFSKVPAGNYYLKVEADSDWGDGSKPPVTDYIKIYRDVPQWSNFWFLFAFLCIGPAIFYYLRYQFEVNRWADSDHPMTESS